jgi:hypothetical protein
MISLLQATRIRTFLNLQVTFDNRSTTSFSVDFKQRSTSECLNPSLFTINFLSLPQPLPNPHQRLAQLISTLFLLFSLSMLSIKSNSPKYDHSD